MNATKERKVLQSVLVNLLIVMWKEPKASWSSESSESMAGQHSCTDRKIHRNKQHVRIQANVGDGDCKNQIPLMCLNKFCQRLSQLVRRTFYFLSTLLAVLLLAAFGVAAHLQLGLILLQLLLTTCLGFGLGFPALPSLW